MIQIELEYVRNLETNLIWNIPHFTHIESNVNIFLLESSTNRVGELESPPN